MLQYRKKGRLIAACFAILLFSGCSNAAETLLPTAPPAPTVLATPILHNDVLPSETVAVPTPVIAAETQTLASTVEGAPPVQPPPDPKINVFGAAMGAASTASGLSLMSAAGSAWTRLDFPWKKAEPNEGERLWENNASLDAEITAFAAQGMQVILILGETPEWAMDPNHPLCGGRVAQAKLGALANFAGNLVARYSQAPFNIRYYELWNEPEVDSFLGCWGEPSDPLGYYGGFYYGEMLKVVYPAMKAANPEAQIMVGGLLLGCNPDIHNINADGSPQDCTMTDFFSGILASTAGSAFDGVSFHAYDYYHGSLGLYKNENFAASWDTTGPATVMKAKYLRDKMAAFGVVNKLLMNTEAGLFCDGTACQNAEYEATKAYYVVEAYLAAQADGYLAMIWYSVFGGRGNGLLTDNLEPLPAYNSFKFTQSMLKDMPFVNQPNAGDGVRTYEFASGGKEIIVLWSVDGQEHTLILTVPPQAMYRIGMDGNGAAEPAVTEIRIGRAPLFILYDTNP